MTRHGVNLVLSIGACELAPGAPRLQGARPLGNRGMSLLVVRRAKAALSSGCKSHPATAPAGSNRSSHGGNEVAEAFDLRVTNW